MDLIKGVRLCPYCADRPAYPVNALACQTCRTKRPARAVYVEWAGDTADERQAEQDALDSTIHSDSYGGWIRPTIAVEGPIRRIVRLDVHLAQPASEIQERLARDQISAVFLTIGLTSE